jgi:hypothetical protein
MYISDLFEFTETFNKEERVFYLSYKIPEATAVGSYFHNEPVTHVSEDAEQALINMFNSFAKYGEFIQFYCGDSGISDYEAVEDARMELMESLERVPSALLGSWEYSRKDREISIRWNVPDWFQGHESIHEADQSELEDKCKDWYISFEMNDDEDIFGVD